uniref:Uncharacterized protein n=1 Tax=Panagrolaimus superbus TaxID=310955 RepID=A0A914YCI3_9BILA
MVKPDDNHNFQELFWECNEDSCVNFIDSVTKKAVFILKAPKADSYKRECKSLKDFANEEHWKNWCQRHQEKSLLPLAVEVNACNMRSYVIMSYKAFLANSVNDAAFKINTFTLSSSGILGTGEKCLING